MSYIVYDFAIIGAGAAGLHLAQAMLEDEWFEDKKILIYEGLGNSYLFSSKYKKAESYYMDLLGIYKQRKDQQNISRAYSNLANLFYEQYQDTKAETYFLKALNAVENTSFIRVKQQVLYNLHMVNKGLGKHKEALDYLSKSNVLKDSIWNRDKVWELAEKDKQISIAQKDKELFIQTEKTEKQTRRLQWGAGILVLVLLFELACEQNFQFLKDFIGVFQSVVPFFL